MEVAAPFYVKPYEELDITTLTMMVYSNISLTDANRQHLFCTTPIMFIDPPLTKKKKNIDKKKLRSDYGTIISLQYYPPPSEEFRGVYFRGLRLSKKKTYWCSLCQLYNNRGKPAHTVIEDQCDVSEKYLGTHITEEELKIYPPDTKKIIFKCENCNRYLKLGQLGKIVPFLNQLTIVISIGGILINTMVFDTSFKIAGNKSFEDAVETVRLLWEDYMMYDKLNWSHTESKGPRKTDVHFLFDTVMMNVDFELGFSIDKKKLNTFMQQPQFKHIVYMSQYESTSVTHVNIKTYSDTPTNFTYDVLVYRQDKKKGYTSVPYFAHTPHRWYITKKPKKNYTTLIVFSSSQTILSGRHHENMKRDYEFFVNVTRENKEEIMEYVSKPKISIQEFLEQYEKKMLTGV